MERQKDIEKIKALHGLKNNFELPSNFYDNLLNQFEDNKKINEIERFYAGYDIEELFRFVFSPLPWVKLVTKLDQDQLPTYSKQNYQVPDFLLYYEDNKLKDHPLFVEVKSVNENKLKLQIMSKQFESLVNFSSASNIPLIFAVYWKKMSAWVFIAPEFFRKKLKTYEITMTDSLMYDISMFLSNFTLLLSTVYLKTFYDKKPPQKDGAYSEKFGNIIKVEFSMDGEKYSEISTIEASVFDSIISFEVGDAKDYGNEIILIQKNRTTYMPRVSYIAMRFLKLYNKEINYEYALFATHTVFDLIKKLKIPTINIIPSKRSKTTDKIFKNAFSKSDTHKQYLSRPKI
jgi:Holliday junction resolvase